MKGRKVVRISVYADEELVHAFNLWRAKHLPLAPQTKAIERIIWDRIRQDEAVSATPSVLDDAKRLAEMQAMKAAGKTQREIAERFGFSQSYVSKILRAAEK
jgi:DNA-directed RNA polymerase specialized sigma subunit